MSHEILLRQLKLGSEDRPFVIVGVLSTEGPTAVKMGNKAIILPDGSVEGWIGGHCTENEIVSTALDCLRDGTTRFLSLTTCQGGRMDVYLEPYLPKRRLIIFGHVPIVSALTNLARSLNFTVTIVDRQATKEKFPLADKIQPAFNEDQIKNQTFAVVATMGEFDLEHISKLCNLSLPYIGVVAGKKRASEIYSYLNSKNIPKEQIERVKSPAGIYIRAVTAEEIALSIMAEIVEIARSQNRADIREFTRMKKAGFSPLDQQVTEREPSSFSEKKVEIDPVCGMTVENSSEYYSKTGSGEMIYFCCESCKESFDNDPQKYVLTKSS